MEKFPIDIIKEGYCYITRQSDPSDPWDGDNISNDYTIEGFELVKNSKWGDFYLNEKPSFDKTFFLVYVIYSTGDSFHREDGCVEYMGLFDNEDDAEFVQDHIYENKENQSLKNNRLILPSGMEFEYSNSAWWGYFENFDCVQIKAIRRIK